MPADLAFKTAMEFAYGEAAPVSPGVARIVANNPSPLTFKGTNTYLVGMTSLAVVDPGPGDPEHLAAILAAAGPRPITHIFATHTHRDHVDGVAALQAATGALICAYYPSGAPPGLDYVNYDLVPDIALTDGDHIAGLDWALTAIYTPGHARDHLCFALKGRGILFSGDHVMAWNTTIVAPPEGRMADYMKSLEILLDRRETLFLPGHGGRLEAPIRTVRAYLLHRRWREQAILDAIRSGTRTIRTLVPVVYRVLDDRLSVAASLSIQAHVEHLIERGLVTSEGRPTLDLPLCPA